jgi:hypothetical protein
MGERIFFFFFFSGQIIGLTSSRGRVCNPFGLAQNLILKREGHLRVEREGHFRAFGIKESCVRHLTQFSST